MRHSRHLHLRSFLILWNIYFASSLVIPNENAKQSTGNQFGRRALAATHLALESSIPESVEMASVGSLPTKLKPPSFPSTPSLQNQGSLSGEIWNNKITPLEGKSISQSRLSHGFSLSNKPLDKSGASTTSISGKAKESEKVKASWWKNRLPRALKSWWKRIINPFSSLQKYIRRSFSKMKINDESTANQATKNPHGSIPDTPTINGEESMADQATKIPHHHSNVDDEIFHDALSNFQENPSDRHLTSVTTKAQPALKENHVPTEAQAALTGNLSPKEAQVLPQENYSPVKSQAPPQVVRPTFHETVIGFQKSAEPIDASLHQSQLAIAELAWKLIQREENWNTVMKKVFQLNRLVAGTVRKHLQKFTNNWKSLYDLQKEKSGVDHLGNHKTLREALDNPSDTATREGYDRFLASLKAKEPIIKQFVDKQTMEMLQVNVARQLDNWYQNPK